MTRLTFPLSRIEGHAQVVIEVEDGEVLAARFQALEFRGFHYLMQGVPAEQVTVIAPRICGVCSTAHHLAAVKALEDAYGVEPPPLACKLRELLMLGQIIQNQATSLFIFTMPDRLGTSSLFQTAGVEGSEEERAGLAQRALRVRDCGTELIRIAGGQFIHPIKAIIGGMTSGITRKEAYDVRQKILLAMPLACELVEYYWELSLQLRERIGTWGDDTPTHYVASSDAECPNYDTRSIRMMCPEGDECEHFGPAEFLEAVQFEESEYSYAGRSSYKGHPMRANSLARINMATRMGTECADRFLERFRREFGQPAHGILLFDLCRGIELAYALARSVEILSEPLDHEDTQVPYTPRDGIGCGVVEAPRGPLIHRYVIENGLIAQADFVIPTVHNYMAIEQALDVAARRYVSRERIDMELERAVGRVVRAFDPCIACATH